MKKLFTGILVLAICVATFSIVTFTMKETGASEKLSYLVNESGEEKHKIDFNAEFSNKTMHYYNKLDSKEQKAYIDMYAAFIYYEESYTLEISADEILDVFTAVLYDNCEIFWVKSDYQYVDYGDYVVFQPSYFMDQDDAEEIAENLEDKVEDIAKSANEYSTDYEKEIYIHDYICENVYYDESTYETVGSTVYSALLDGRAICEGYARATQILLEEVGIDSYLIIGDATSNGVTESHMWNIVTINGKNYHLDTTWDDVEEYTEPSYLYFNLPDELIFADHSNLKPASNNCKYMDDNYYYRNRTYLTSYSGYANLTSVCSTTLSNGKKHFEIRFENDGDYNKAVRDIENDNGFFDFVDVSARWSNADVLTDEINYYLVEELNYICIVFIEG